MAGIVLDARAVPHLLHHFQIVARALLQPLRFQQPVLRPELLQPLLQLRLDGRLRAEHLLRCRHIMGRRKDRDVVSFCHRLAGEHVELREPVDLVAEHLDAHRRIVRRRREDVDRIPMYAERVAGEIHVVPQILHPHQPREDRLLRDLLPRPERQPHGAVILRVAQAVDARHGRHDDHIPPLEERHRRRVAQPVDLLIHGRILLDVRVRRRDVRFRLVIIVVAHEIIHRVVREEILELAGRLCGERLVRRDDERRPLHLLDHLRHGERLPRARRAEQHLRPLPLTEPLHQRRHRLRLIAHRLKRRLQRKRRHVLRVLSFDAGILHGRAPSSSCSVVSPYYTMGNSRSESRRLFLSKFFYIRLKARPAISLRQKDFIPIPYVHLMYGGWKNFLPNLARRAHIERSQVSDHTCTDTHRKSVRASHLRIFPFSE